MEILFGISVTFMFYTYVGYPIYLFMKAKFFHCTIARATCSPFVSVVIAVCNEEKVIGQRLNNLLSQDYPADRFQIVVVSDGSQDNTNSIVLSFATSKVLLLSYEKTLGKAVALNRGVSRANGEIVVFTDARQLFEPDTLTLLVRNFSEMSVGCVSGELILLEESGCGRSVEMGAYWRYEKTIRNLESASGSVVGATGAIYAIRKSLYVPLPPNTILDDVLTPMNIAGQGFRVVFDPAPRAYDNVSKSLHQEWGRKVRTLAGNLQLLAASGQLVLPWRFPLWWRFLSHKVFRLFVPFFLPCLFASSFCCREPLIRAALCLQILLYLSAFMGYFLPALQKVRLVKFAIFFIVMNSAALAGFWVWVSGRCATVRRPVHAK